METDYKCVTLEDLHGAITEEEYFEQLAQRDALECSVGCMNWMVGYHTRSCPRQTEEDKKTESRNETSINIALGK